ncbi:MAG: hypothetical protein IJI73_10300, partial [Kiritimatiellae bacterium]|nr:hypothetical protein [Kiritimatiellia bacterium]
GDGDPSIITENDFDVSYSDNVNAGTAKATFTGKGNYTGTVEEEFDIQRADNEWTTEPAMAGWTYGQAPSEPTSAAKVGTAVVTYGTAANPGSLGDAKPSLPGSYAATFTVAESLNYNELSTNVEFTISAATINYVADDVSGEYNGSGFGIAATISVSAPASGATIKYATAETGPWQEEPITYKDVCAASPIYFQISAEGYSTVIDSRTVTITPKTLTSDFVWLVLPTEDYVYDGTAKTPDAACGDGDPSIITENDFDVSYSDNVNAGTAKATFTGKGNYTGTVEEEFEIKKAKLTDGEEPGGGTVPTGGLSKFDVTAEYDGVAHTVDATAILEAWQGVKADVAVGYALNEDATDWTEQPESFIDVCVTSVWYKVTLANYDDFVKEVKVTITPRDIANATIAPIADVTYSGSPAEPVPTVTDGDPSIIATDDYDVSYADNVNIGIAKITLAGKNNYTGTVEKKFNIIKAGNAWTTTPAIAGWIYGQAPAKPISAAKFGTAVVTYGTAENPGSLGTKPPVQAGSYVAKFTVAATDSYNGLAAEVKFVVSPKTLTSDFVWLVLPTGDYVYDGAAKEPSAECGDGEPSIISANDFDIVYSDNVNAGTAKATFTGKNNYIGTVEEEFEIKKAKLTDGEEPGDGTVPTGGLSKFDVTAEYDGVAHTVDAPAILAAWQGVKADVAVGYALRADATDWTEHPESFVDVCETSVWYKVTLANYDDFVKEVKVTITPRDIANATIAPIADVAYSGSPAEPVPTVTDGDPSIITTDDYDVSYAGNDAPGTATLTLAGKRNYTGFVTVDFTIVQPVVTSAALSAEIAWKYLRTTGTYFAQLKVSCTNGLELGIDNLRFAFVDRIAGDGRLNAALWHTPSRGVNSNVAEINGAPCRFVELDASLIAMENEDYVFGVTDVRGESVPVSERVIELYTRRRVAPCAGNEARGEVDDFVGYLVWTSGGDEHAVPVLAEGEDGTAAASAALQHDRAELRVVAANAGDVPFAAEGPMPTMAAQYFGALFDEDGVVCGSVEVTLKKANRRAGARKAKLKIEPIGGRKISFTGVVGLDGTVSGRVAGYDVSLVMGEKGLSGVIGAWSVSCARARGASRDDIAVRVEQLKGRTYGIVLGTTDANAGFIRENSEIMVKVSGRGKTRIKGVLADGTRVSASSSVVVAGGGAVCVPVVVRAFRGKKGGFGFLLWMDGDEISVTGLSGLNTTGAKKAFDLEWDVSRCGIVK